MKYTTTAILLLITAVIGGVAGGYIATQALQSNIQSSQQARASAGENIANNQQILPAINSYADAVSKAENAVVNIFTSARGTRSTKKDDYSKFFSDANPDSSGIGSGVVISDDGLIITNYHVIQKASQIFIGSEKGDKPLAKIIGKDPETDIALLQADIKNSQPITFADSSKLQNGDVVLAIGNPFGVGKTVTMGIVSALGRSDVGINTYERFIQTDAAINPGNSGGALINTNGELVGINTAIVSSSGSFAGIAFAVPSNQVQDIVKQLKKHGEIIRGWLGVSIHTAYIDTYERNFAEVVGLFSDGPAEAAGMAPGDLLLKINNQEVEDANTARELISAIAPGEKIEMLINRQGKEITIAAISSKRPSLTE